MSDRPLRWLQNDVRASFEMEAVQGRPLRWRRVDPATRVGSGAWTTGDVVERIEEVGSGYLVHLAEPNSTRWNNPLHASKH